MLYRSSGETIRYWRQIFQAALGATRARLVNKRDPLGFTGALAEIWSASISSGTRGQLSGALDYHLTSRPRLGRPAHSPQHGKWPSDGRATVRLRIFEHRILSVYVVLKVACFELYRRNIRSPEILTFDELYYRASRIVENLGGETGGDI
jgi:hypothetical protein